MSWYLKVFHLSNTVITQKDSEVGFGEFKIALNSFEKTDICHQTDTFELVPSVLDRAVIGGKCVYVAKGYAKIKDIDCQEPFSPTPCIVSVRMLLQYAIQEDLVVHQLDVKTAYVNTGIDCDVYLDQPEGYCLTNSKNDYLVCKLKKCLYGLKQSGRNWNIVLHKFLLSEGLQHSIADNCVYMRSVDNVRTIIVIWVDDMIIAASMMF